MLENNERALSSERDCQKQNARDSRLRSVGPTRCALPSFQTEVVSNHHCVSQLSFEVVVGNRNNAVVVDNNEQTIPVVWICDAPSSSSSLTNETLRAHSQTFEIVRRTGSFE